MFNKLTFGLFGQVEEENKNTPGEEDKAPAPEKPVKLLQKSSKAEDELQMECSYCKEMVSSLNIDEHEIECQQKHD